MSLDQVEKVQAQGSACLLACPANGHGVLAQLGEKWTLGGRGESNFVKLSTWTPSKIKLPATPQLISKREHHHLSEPPTGAIMANPLDAYPAAFIRRLEEELGMQPPPAITTLEEFDALVPEPCKNQIPHPPPAPTLVMTPTPPPPPDLTGMDLHRSKQKLIN